MKKYNNFLVLALLLLAFSASTLSAYEGEKIRVAKPMMKAELKQDRGALRSKMEQKRQEFRNTLKSDLGAFKEEVKVGKKEFKSAKPEKKAQFCKAAGNMVSQKFDSAVKNLESFQARLENVIKKLKADGKDTTLAEESLALSKSKLAEAKNKLTNLRALVPASCENVTADTFEQVKLASREVKNLLKEVKSDLQQAVRALKELKGAGDDSTKDNDEEGENENN